MIPAVPAWARPTAKLLPWAALVVPLVAAAALSEVLAAAGNEPPHVLALGTVAALAGALALSLDDPARDLTAALPVGRRRRTAHRLALVAPVALAGWWVAGPKLLPGTAAGTVVGLGVSLSAVAIAVAVVVDRWRPGAGTAAGVATPFAVVSCALLLVQGGIVGSLLDRWAADPWPVAVVAGAVAAFALPR